MPSGEGAVAPKFIQLAAHPVRWQLLSELARSDYRVRELETRIEAPQSLISYHLRLLREGGLVSAARSSFDGRDSYYHLDLDACAEAFADSGASLHPGMRRDASPPVPRSPRVAALFVCTGNSARSPIAEALFRHHNGGGVNVVSAGSVPKPSLHPNTIRVMREEFGIDISGQYPRHLDTLAGRRFDQVVTLCDKAREVCPDFGEHSRRVHWSIPEPGAAVESDQASYPAFQRTAEEINTRIGHLLPVLVEHRP